MSIEQTLHKARQYVQSGQYNAAIKLYRGLLRLTQKRLEWLSRLQSNNAFEAESSRSMRVAYLDSLEFAKVILPSETEIALVLNVAATGPQTAQMLIGAITNQRKPYVLRSLAWLLKLNVLKVSG